MTFRKVKFFILAMSLLLCSCPLRAQQMQASLSHYSTDDGLASNAIGYLTQDDLGYIWIATWNGLSRFDGYNFYNYATGAGSRIPNLHNRIYDIAVDISQNIWLRMYDNRVFVLRRSIDQIVNPFEGITGNEEFRSSHPITVTSSGYVLVNVEGIGLYKMKPETDGFSSELITTGDLTVTSMAEGYQNDIWLGTDKGVHRMDVSNLTVDRKGYFLDEHITCLYSNGYNIFAATNSGKIMSFSYGQDPVEIKSGGEAINALFVDSHGLIWYTDKRQGAVRLNPETGNEKLFAQRVIVPDMDGHGGKFHEADGTVWVRMNRGGFGYYNRQTDEVEYFHNDPISSWNLSNTVNASLVLNEGVVWESTSRRGLDKLEIMRKVIARHQLHPEAGVSMENEIRAMYYDNVRKWLLIGNKAGELYITRKDSSRTVITHDNSGKPFGRIYGISKDSKGNFWLSTKGNGIFCLTPTGAEGFSTQHYGHDDKNKWTLNNDGAYATVEDPSGNIWIATFGGGVNLLTKNKTGQAVVLNCNNAMKNYPYNSHNKVRSIAIDRDGMVWAGTSDGILIMSYKDNKLSIKKLEPSQIEPDHMLMSNDIVCLARDSQGDMWVGTNGGGLAHAYGKDADGYWLFEHFGARDGLPGEEIRSLTFDNRGNVWFSTDHVLCSFDTAKRIFTTFSSLEGVDETMCSEGAAITLPGDDILFGTLNGYYEVNRSKLTTTMGNVLKLRITDFWLNDELQSPRLTNNYDYYVPDSRSVVLPDNNSLFAFRFASLNYQLQHRVHYQYMLEGYEHAWQNADRTHKASYSDLPTGNYTFRVKAFLLESPEKFDMRQIEVIVPPPFLLTSSAIWLYMLIIAVVCMWLLIRRQQYLSKNKASLLSGESNGEFNMSQQEDVVFIERLKAYLNIHVSDPMLMPDELAEASNMEMGDFTLMLHQITGLSPQAFINDYRLKKALDMLENTDETIAAIVFQCGYADVSAFTRQLKQKLDVTPSQYRDAHRKKPTDDTTSEEETTTDSAATQEKGTTDVEVTDDYEIIE